MSGGGRVERNGERKREREREKEREGERERERERARARERERGRMREREQKKCGSFVRASVVFLGPRPYRLVAHISTTPRRLCAVCCRPAIVGERKK